MEFKMKLTDEQKAILNGRDGEVMAKVMETAIWSRASGFLS